ncbi:hypothetical protein ACEE90_13190 [Corynebacterium phoceense]
MSHTPYVVPDHGFGAARTLPINGIDADVFAGLLGSADVRTVSVILGTPAASANDSVGLTVRHDGVQIGTIDAQDSAEYTELDWILGAGLSPEVSARLTLDDNGWPLASVVLPAPGLCVPANNPPAVRWAMLDGGVGIPVQGIPTSLASYPREPQHFLVTLRARRFLGRRSVSAYVDGVFIGTLRRDDALQLADAIISYDHSGLVSVARGYYKYNEGHPTLTIYADAETPARKPFAAVAGTAATTGMVLSAAAAARAEAAVPMTGFFTGGAGTAATGASAGATLASVTSLGSSATGSTSTTSTAGASATTSAAASTATTTAATTAAASGVSLQAIAAASTAIVTVGGLGVATNNIINNQSSDAPLTVASGPSTAGSASSPDGDGDVDTDAQASTSSRADSSADSTCSDSSAHTDGDRTAGQGSTREASTRTACSAAANDASRQGDAETAQRSATGATATGTNTTGTAPRGTAPAAVNPTVANQGALPDTNSGITLDELRRLTRDDNLILAKAAPSTTAAASPTTTTAASVPATASPLPSAIVVNPADKTLADPTPTSTAQVKDTKAESSTVITSDDNSGWAFDFVTPETTTSTAAAPATATTTTTAAERTDAPTTSPAESTTTAAPTTAKATATTTAPATSAQATTETATATTPTTAADATDTRSGTRQCGTDFWGIIVYCIIIPIVGGSDTATTTDEPTAEAITPKVIEDPATKAPAVLEPTPAVEDTPQELAVETPTETVS